MVLMVDDEEDDDGFFLFGLVTVNPEPLPTGEVFMRMDELERGKLTWHCFMVTSLSGVLSLAAAAAVAVMKYVQTLLY